MAYVNQLYNLLNETTKEIVGLQILSVKDTASFLSLGDAVLSSASNKEAFYSKLPVIIGKYTYKIRALKHKTLNIEVDNLTYGGMVARIGKSKIARTRESESFKNDGLNEPFSYIDDTKIELQLFQSRGTFDIETKVILDHQMNQAFRSEADMMAFVNAIYSDIDDGFELAERDLEHLTLSTMAAVALNGAANATPLQGVNLLDAYNTAHPTATLTVAECFESKDFLAYASRQIKRTLKYLGEVSTRYNSLQWEKESDDIRVRMHTDFVSASEYYLESDTFHNTFVALPSFEEYTYLQANDGTFETTSSINIKNGSGLSAVSQTGIIAILHDGDAAATTYKNRRINTMYNGDNERTYVYPKEDYGALVDKSAQCVVFYVAETDEETI